MTGWIQTPLGELCDITMGQSPPSNTYNTEKSGLPFFQGKAEFSDLYPVPQKWCCKPQKKADDGDILISVRAPVGDVNIANQHCCIGRGLAAIKYDACPKFIFYFLKHSKGELDKLSTGTTFKAISKQTIFNYSLFIPSLKEQNEIVAKIEELFSELDNGVESLKKAREQLKTYRQAVLKYAFEGKLTNKIGNENIPDNWKIERLGDCLDIVSGNTPKGVNDIQNCGKIPFYKVADMNTIGNEVYMKEANLNLTQNEVKLLKIKLFPKGTVIFPKRGGAILTNKKRILNTLSGFDLNLMGAIPNENVGGLYLYYWFQKLDLSKIYDGSNVPQINNKNIAPLDIPIPPINEQGTVVEEIETRLSVCDQLEQTIEESLKKAEALRQSILKKAFEGELTREWRNAHPELISSENSAESLLAHIRAEKENTRKKIPQRRKGKTKK